MGTSDNDLIAQFNEHRLDISALFEARRGDPEVDRILDMLASELTSINQVQEIHYARQFLIDLTISSFEDVILDGTYSRVVADGTAEQGGPFDSQQRFQNDLFIDNLRVLGANDYDGDGFQEVYWRTVDGTAYLRSLMHADGNIQYANYQNEQQMIDYLAAQGYDAGTWGNWIV